jgi:hypothetical protein
MSIRSHNRRHDRQFFYKYATSEAAAAIITSQRLRWSSPLCFNDPLDVPRNASLAFSATELQVAVREDFLSVLGGERETSSPMMLSLARSLSAERDAKRRQAVLDDARASFEKMAPTSSTALDLFQQVWSEMVPKLRILCLSEICDSLSMWTYYAEGHKGVVLKFEVSDELDSSLLLAQPVRYSDVPPALPPKEVWARALVDEEKIDWQQYFTEYHYVKTTQWQHEREWRVITYAPEDDNAVYSDKLFHPRELSGIYLGAQIKPSSEAAIVAAMRGPFGHVELRRSRVDYERRRLTFDES